MIVVKPDTVVSWHRKGWKSYWRWRSRRPSRMGRRKIKPDIRELIRRSLGRTRADRIIVESQFQLDGFTSFAKAARAIVDANRNLYNNKHKSRLVRIFHDRGIGPVE